MIKSAINKIAIRKIQNVISLLCLVMLAVLLTGCGSKEEDVTKNQVLKITITPTPAITPSPEELNPKAVVSKDGVTMINLYLLEHPEVNTGTDSETDSKTDSKTDSEAGLTDTSYDEEASEESEDEEMYEESTVDVLMESVEDAEESGEYEEDYEDYEND